MVKQRRAALVYAGRASRGSLTRLPGLAEQLRFVKSSSVATASRAVHSLRGGKAVRSFLDLDSADLIVISVPEALVAGTVEDLNTSGLNWAKRFVVLYDSELDSAVLSSLARQGAITATLNYSPIPERFVAEGDPDAIRRLRSLVAAKELLILHSKADYLHGMRASMERFLPLLASVVDDFRRAGMEKAIAQKTAATMLSESARAYLRAGRRLLKQPVTPPV